MADETTPAGDNGQNVQVFVDERELRTSYSNAYRIVPTDSEVVVDFGFNMAVQNPQQGTGPQMLFKINDRVIMNFANAKKLSMSLLQLIKRYEQQFGEIDLGQGQQPPRR